MSNNISVLKAKLHELDLSTDEARLYLELLKGPNTHLRLSHSTGINRTKVYRLVEQLEKRSLVTRRTDDRGTFLVASDPSALEIELVAREEKLKHQRDALGQIVPLLSSLHHDDPSAFAVYTYEGAEGFKQMLWHELKTHAEILALGSVTLEQLVDDRRWAEQLRSRAVEAGYSIREIVNKQYDNIYFSQNQKYLEHYIFRTISPDKLPIETPMVIYNNTVSIYQPWNGEKVGVEIISKPFANTMRHIFEQYWLLSTPHTTSHTYAH